ncbi:uncharacterized protein BT62DRAFT_888421 [Guyanagaster necrorhizus]|uniref:BTB domain-containing protein n=1 Tax=Guyanagaster necrorhizus TaxID=856835 RepID=A0A9P7VYV9_9AGAR|nr:uncharacterized protein BT62DRAFT_888421 [Guyanagaster necrorhizus MCA 3950]KAG7449477.1 hypothetical protein BT62DRAFT_888421 [Guyanagaster necrorhizus MCA 3950]
MGYVPAAPEESTRQWTFMGLEWIIRDIRKLRDYIEGPENTESSENLNAEDHAVAEHGDFEVLKESPVMGDNKFKLEIARSHAPSDVDSKTLSLYITSLALDFAHPDYELPTSMMTAIKCQDDRVGERGARPEWVWEFWQNDWVFRQESEVWACSLPSLSFLLENSRIRETDSFVICVQIHCPIGPLFPSHPSAYYVPRDLLDGLEASLDNPNTGDVRFVCLEKLCNDINTSPTLNTPEVTSPVTHRSPSSTSSHSLFSAQTTARKRIIYAHSDILTRRSDYFATMLASSFAENQGVISGGRKLLTIVVEEADFETVYWLLKFCYANWLLFKERDDPRAAVEGIGAGLSAKWLHAHGGEWDWKTFPKSGHGDDVSVDARSATSGDSATEQSRSPTSGPTGLQPGQMRTTPSPRSAPSASTSKTSTSATSRMSSTAANMTTTTAPRRASAIPVNMSGTSSSRSKQTPVPLTVPPNYSSSGHYPISPQSQRPRQTSTTPDPHVHPTPPPPPASALSMYQVAHRYSMPTLANLALEHMMATLTPQSSFALLLATSSWDELRSLVEDYVVDKWDEVSVSEEFEQCCQEVAAGEWGSEGGKTMTALFRRLRSPSVIGYVRA